MEIRQAWIVYHRPSYKKSEKELFDFLADLQESIQTELRAITIDEFDKNYSGGQVFLLLLYRGGHYCSIIKSIHAKNGCFTGIIPLDLTTIILASIAIRNRDCGKIKLLHHKPKRCLEYYNYDLSRITSNVQNITGIKIEPASPEDVSNKDCIILFTLLKSKMIENSENSRILANGLFPQLKDGLAWWITQALGW
ncbi:MAG: hypothetical protein GSR79_04925 [Desulfurococcales archaeon]|nr:hypothetical protein [Desulfurococcales archaeon]